jgi:hypothetical protein
MYLELLTSPQTIVIAVCDGDYAARSKPCDNCGRKIARRYAFLRGRNMRVCDDCAKLAERVH